MDVREKLVELLKQTEINKINGHTVLAETCFTPNVFENMANNLIAHGVTVQEWISVKDRLPEPGERVLVCIGAVFEAFIDDAGKWQRYYSAPLNEVLGEPTHWMPLPQPPKGE